MAALAVPLLTSGISALAGLFSKPSKSTTNSSENTSSTTGYNYTPQQQDMIDQLTQNYNSRLNGPEDLSGYGATGLQNINQASNNAKTMSNNILASRGLAGSPLAAFSNIAANASQGAQQSSLENSLPLIQRQDQLQSLQGIQNLFSSMPKGSTTTGSASGTSTTTGASGGGAGGLLGGLGAALAGPSGNGVSNATQIANNLPGGLYQGYNGGPGLSDVLQMLG